LSDSATDPRPAFRRFAETFVAPHAAASDAAARLDGEVIEAIRREGFLGAPVSAACGGRGMTMVDYGLLTAEVARACASARTLLTVHNMVALTLERWAGAAMKAGLLESLARGRALAAFALSEPDGGSDIQSITTTIAAAPGGFRLNGRKAWTSFGMLADWFLVFGQSDGGSLAVMVPADAPGLSRRAEPDMTGTRASLIAHLEFDDCRVPSENRVGRPGFGLSHVAATALDHGRYSVAWAGVGIIEACLEATRAFLGSRHQFGRCMADLPLAKAAVSRMFVDGRAARQLCLSAGALRDRRSADALVETMAAKYFASAAAARAANAAVRLHGARGLLASHPVQRLLRDAKVLEVIEGGEEIHELLIASQLGRGDGA
jgi:alkylation response protein AidB-like acyl-CoA dehydrogenase